MRSAFRLLCNALTAFAVVMLGVVVVSAPAVAADSTLPAGFSLCHATGSASTVEGVRNWVRNNPNDSGQASGHAGAGHQNGLDIIPPIPGVLPHGQNWSTYGQQVHANGCNIPTYVDVNATFTDQHCQAKGYVPAAFSAPAYNGITRTVSGLGANGAADPGETVSVSYTGTAATIINGASSNAKSFTHTFPAQPSGLRDCVAQPPAETRSVPRSEPSCALDGVSSWVDVYTTPYVWSDAQQQWVLGQESGPVRTNESVTPYGDDEYFELCAPDRPAAEVRSVPQSTPSCDLAGVTSWNDVYAIEYVWSAGQRAWVLGQETGPVKADETFAAFTDEEFFEACAEPQPPSETRSVPESSTSCDPAGVTSWNDVYVTEYVWSAGQRAWLLGQETGPVKTDETFTAYTDEEFFEGCAPAQPPAETRGVPQGEPSCALGGVTRWNDVYTTEYVWNADERAWVLGQETGPVRSGVTFSPYTDGEYFELCAPAQPAAEERRVPQDLASCELGGDQSWVDVYTTEYMWNADERAWEPADETGPVRTDESFDAYTDDEYYELCADYQPAAETRSEPQTWASCDPAGVTSWDDVYTTEYVWDGGQRRWVLGQETGPVRSGVTFSPYTDGEYFELCAPAQPAAEERRVPQDLASCELGGDQSWVDVYTTEYMWNADERAWEPADETGPVRTDESFDAYTDDEYYELCADYQPAAETRSEPQTWASCDPAGVTSWDDVYTTEYVWDGGQRRWVLGQETGPVRSGVAFSPYTDGEYFELCAPAQPAAEERRVPENQPSCELGGIQSWVDVYTTEYVWDAVARAWEPGAETGPVVAAQDFTPYTDAEYFNYCSERKPASERREVPRSDPSCHAGGVTSWTDVFTTPHVWNAGTRAWEPGEESGPVKSDETFTAYTDDEFYELCAGEQPAAVQRQAAQSVPSCDLAGVARWIDVYTTEHLWNSEARAWALGEETGPVRDGEQFTPYTDAEYFELCAPARPAPIVVEVAGVQASCKIRGSRTWVDVYTTEHVWNAESRAWEPGEESGPVRTDETFVEYTDQELAKACTEVEAGEPPADPAVDDPAAPSVPTVVNAGLGPTYDPSAQSRHPLWFLAMVGGLGLMGSAGLRRRSDGEPVAHDRRAAVSQ